MPKGVEVHIDGDYAEVVFTEPGARAAHFTKLLEADPQLQVDTSGTRRSYRTLADAVKKAGLVDTPKKAPAKKAPAKATPPVEGTPDGDNS